MTINKRHFAEFFFGFFFLCVLLGTILPVFFPMANMFSSVGKDISSGRYLFLASIFFGAVIVSIFYFFRDQHITKKQLIITIALLAAASMVARFYYVFSFNQEYYSDFRAYWNIASEMVENGLKPVTNVYIQRALAFNYPLIYFFGSADVVFKISNVILLTISSLIASFIAGRWISYGAAIAVFAIISVFPETYYASLIPTHDITGSFYLMVCFLFAFLSIEKAHQEKYRLSFLFACCLAISLIPLEMQRNLFQIFIATFGFSLIVYAALSFKNIHGINNIAQKTLLLFLIVVIFPYTFYNISYQFLEGKLLMSKASAEYGAIRQKVRFNTLNDGTYHSQISQLEKNFVGRLPGDLQCRSSFMSSLFLSDLYYTPLERPANYFLRAERLYNLGSQLGFYMSRLRNLEKQEIRNQIDTARLINRSFYSLFFLVLSIASVYALFFQKTFNLIAITPLIFMSAGSFALVTIGENQSRYLFMGYFLWPLFIAGAFFDWWHKPVKSEPMWNISFVKFGKYTLLSIVCVVLSLIMAYFVFCFNFKNSDLKMLNLEDFQNVTCNEYISAQTCSQSIVDFEKTITDRKFALLQMTLPTLPERGQFVKNEKTFSVDKNRKYDFSVFVQQPYKRGDGRKGFFDIVVAANDQSTVLHLEDTDEQHYVRLEEIVPVDGKITISFEIRCNNCWQRVSWQRASITNFRFARLYPVASED